ncbi:MAG: methyltransferase [Eubacteriales bacterium]|nr:methyltransferase [Eubacteriales bacterium]
MRLWTDHGIFNHGGLDRGTEVLLEAIVSDCSDFTSKKHVLDFCAGTGIVALLLATKYPNWDFCCVEINERAHQLLLKNAELNRLRLVKTACQDGLSAWPNQQFDLIALNPPIRSGKANVHRLIEEAYQALDQEGSLYIVFGKKQGAESYGRYLAERWPTQRLLRQRGFDVFCVRRNSSADEVMGEIDRC